VTSHPCQPCIRPWILYINVFDTAESNPQCTTNLSAAEAVLENDVITMTCRITYSGSWAPVMRWFDSSRNFTDDVVTLVTDDTVTSQLTVTTSANFHGSRIACLTYFTTTFFPE